MPATHTQMKTMNGVDRVTTVLGAVVHPVHPVHPVHGAEDAVPVAAQDGVFNPSKYQDIELSKI